MKPRGPWVGTYSDLDAFERPGDDLSVETVSIFNLIYGFRAGKLAAVKFKVVFSQRDEALNVLSRAWGEPSHHNRIGIETWGWSSSSSIAVLAKKDYDVGVVIADRKYAQAHEEKKSGL